MTFEMITLSKQMVSTAWFQMLIGGGGGEKKKKDQIQKIKKNTKRSSTNQEANFQGRAVFQATNRQ